MKFSENRQSSGQRKTLKLSLMLIVAVVIMGITAMLLVNRYTSNRLLESFGERSFALTTFTMSEIDRTIQSKLHDIERLTLRLSDTNEVIESNRLFESLQNRKEIIQQRDEQWQNTPPDELNELMKSIINNGLSKQLREENPPVLINPEGEKYSPFPEIIVTNKFGANVAQTNRTTDYYQADEAWWQEATKDKVVVEDVEFDDSADAYSINISAPIKNDSGEVIGAVKVVWNIEEIIQLVNSIESERQGKEIFGKTTNFTLLTKDLEAIFSSRDDLDFLEDVSNDRIGSLLKSDERDELFTIIRSETSEGKEVAQFLTYARSAGFEQFNGLGWTLVLEQETNEIIAPIRSTQVAIGIILSVFILLIIYMNYAYTKHIRNIQKLKDEFVSVASHQLKTPLANNRWSLESLEDYKDRVPKEAQEFLQTLTESNARMTNLVNDLLNLSRLESGRLEIKPQEEDVIRRIQATIKDVLSTAATKNETIEFKPQTESLKLNIDRSVFDLIMNNLLTNAIKYSKEGGKVLVSIRDNQQGFYEIGVKDNGIGIPKDMQSNMFNKFYRAENAKKSEIKGTGLGLFVVANIVKGLGGDIWFDSEENKGTTFYFTLDKKGMPAKKISAY